MNEENNPLKIKYLAEDDRPREKLLHKGKETLSNAELLAIIIGSGSKKESAVQLSMRILSTYGDKLHKLGRCEVDELKNNFKGVGLAKAISIVAALELGKRRSIEEVMVAPSIRDSRSLYEIFKPHFVDKDKEECWVVFTNNSKKVIDISRISQGGFTTTVVDPRVLLKNALLKGAVGIAIAHNHPSGTVVPSMDDNRVTQTIKNSCKILCIDFFDHLIIAGNEYYSYSDHGLI